MNPAAPKYPPKVTSSTPRMDFAGQTTGNTSASSASSSAAKPVVMSAKDAINAMYSERQVDTAPKLISSAREAVNAAANQVAHKGYKSASNLHHGSLQKIQKAPQPQKSVESTRTSASALLKNAHQDSQGNIPVVHTSLKLGSDARPKPAPVILPPGSRMAQAARPINNPSNPILAASPAANSTTLSSSAVNVQISSPRTPKTLAAPRPRNAIRDPQMLSGGHRVLSAGKTSPSQTLSPSSALPSGQANLAQSDTQSGTNIKVNTTSIPIATSRATSAPRKMSSVSRSAASLRSDISPARKPSRPKRFRSAPKGYTSAVPNGVSADDTYIMMEPPKLTSRKSAAPDNLGVIENYRPSKVPEPLGDTAPIGRLAEQRIASGHGGPAPVPNIKADNTSNYSFSRRDSKEPAKKSSYASAEKSPFLKSVNVEKRPLSDNTATHPISLTHMTEEKPSKASRKNVYTKANAPSRAELPARPTVIVPSSRRSKAPLFFLILLTILLGAVVGAAVYLCFFQ